MARPLNQSLWRQLSEQIMSSMLEWCQIHPKATFREIEIELDARLSQARARMLEDLAISSSAACRKKPRASRAPPLRSATRRSINAALIPAPS
jgi:hypothetical protein